MKLCSQSEKCVFDIKKKLFDLKLPEEDIQNILEILISNNYLNEYRYAISYTKDKLKFNKWGKNKISYLLKQKKISPNIIQTALDDIESIEYENILLQLIQKKYHTIKAFDPYYQKIKLIQFGLNRGFELELIQYVIKELNLNS